MNIPTLRWHWNRPAVKLRETGVPHLDSYFRNCKLSSFSALQHDCAHSSCSFPSYTWKDSASTPFFVTATDGKRMELFDGDDCEKSFWALDWEF